MRQPAHVISLVRKLEQWQTNRTARSGVEAQPLQQAIEYLKEYEDLLQKCIEQLGAGYNHAGSIHSTHDMEGTPHQGIGICRACDAAFVGLKYDERLALPCEVTSRLNTAKPEIVLIEDQPRPEICDTPGCVFCPPLAQRDAK